MESDISHFKEPQRHYWQLCHLPPLVETRGMFFFKSMWMIKVEVKVSKQSRGVGDSTLRLVEGSQRHICEGFINSTLPFLFNGLKQGRGSLLIQRRRFFHLGSNQILWKDFGLSCLSYWRLLTASHPEFPQTAAVWRRVIQARFAIRPLTPALHTLLPTAHDHHGGP